MIAQVFSIFPSIFILIFLHLFIFSHYCLLIFIKIYLKVIMLYILYITTLVKLNISKIISHAYLFNSRILLVLLLLSFFTQKTLFHFPKL